MNVLSKNFLSILFLFLPIVFLSFFPYKCYSAVIPQAGWSLHYADSEELVGEDGAAVNSFDGDVNTFWHTEWYASAPPHPHEIQIDLGGVYDIDGFRYLPRQDGGVNGRIAQYEFYISTDGSDWGTAVATGTFANDAIEKEVTFLPVTGQFIQLRALSEVNGNPWTSMAELNMLGEVSTENQSPTADDDTSSTNEDTAVTIDVVSNDTDIDGTIDVSTVSIVTDAGNGTTVVNGDGTITYTPVFGFIGTDIFTYTVNDNEGATSNEATVTITVSAGINQSPNGVIDTPVSDVTITVGQSVDFSGTGIDPDGDYPLSFLWGFGEGSGILDSTQEDPGLKQFDNVGTFTVTFTVTDAEGLADPTPATRIITVQSGAAIPQTSWSLHYADSEELVGEDGAAVNSFDGDVNTFWHTEWYASAPPHPHEIQIDLGGVYDIDGFRYLPRQDGGVNGRIAQYEFYISTDGSDWGTAVATGTFANDAIEKEVTFLPVTGQFIQLRALSEVNGNPWTSMAELNLLGEISLENQSPTANDDTSSTNEDTAVTIDVVSNDTDIDGTIDVSTVSIVTDAGNGTTVVNGDGTTTYTPVFGFIGTDIFTYTVNDNEGATSNEATVTITVSAGINQSPTANDDTSSTNEDTAVTIDVVSNDTDIDGTIDVSTVSIVTDAGNGTTVVNGDGTTTYTPVFGFIGTDIFTYTVNDNEGATSNEATVTITVSAGINQSPTANDDTSSTNEDTAVTIDVVSNDTDIDGTIDVSTVSIVTDAGNGTTVVNGDGTITYTPVFGFIGTDIFTYTVNDNEGATSNEATVTITVSAGINQPPNGVIDTPVGDVTITVGESIDFSGTGIDPDGDYPLSFLWEFGEGSGILDSTDEDPGLKQFDNVGTFTVTFTVTDAEGLADPTPATRIITVQSDAVIPQTSWSLHYVDSEELVREDGAAVNSFDGNVNTLWHTEWYASNPPHPHEIQIDLGGVYDIDGFMYLPRQDGGVNGRIAQYEFYISTDGSDWGTTVATGTFANDAIEKEVTFLPVTGQFIQLRALSEVNGNPWTSMAELNLLASCVVPSVVILEPESNSLQTSPDVYVLVNACLATGQGVKILLDGGLQDIEDYLSPYETTFEDVSLSDHTVDAFAIDENGEEVPGTWTHYQVWVGIGDYYVAMGDSITEGYGDDNASDDISHDGRNSGGGYEPILNNLLTAALSYPHTIINEGVGGEVSFDGASSIQVIIEKHPCAQRFLVQYGTNDARPWLPVPSGLGLEPRDDGYPGSFKDNMQQIIDEINIDGRETCLAKAPIALGDSYLGEPYPDPDIGKRSVLIKEYNEVIDELANDLSNQIDIIPPDFYSYFNYCDPATGSYRYEIEYFDNLHPNGQGYRSMAEQWFEALTQ